MCRCKSKVVGCDKCITTTIDQLHELREQVFENNEKNQKSVVQGTQLLTKLLVDIITLRTIDELHQKA